MSATSTAPASIDPKILNKVRALMAKAESTDFEAEAETYTAKAEQLMAAYGVTQALLAEANGTKAEPIERRVIVIHPSYESAKNMLCWNIARSMNCTVFYRPARNGELPANVIYGHASDMDRVEFLYTALLMHTSRMLGIVRPPAGSRENTMAYRRSWVIGFGQRVGERLAAATKAAVEDAAPGSALVLVTRADLVRKHAEKAAAPRKRVARRVGSAAGYLAGRNAANAADIGQARVGGTRTALAG